MGKDRSPKDRHSDRTHRRRARSKDRKERRHKHSSTSGSSSSSSKRKRSTRQDDTDDSRATGYGDSNNPFNDASLSKKFVWKKKDELGRAKGLSKSELIEAEDKRRMEAAQELESLRKRRELREIERAQREQEAARARRETEQERLGDWEAREEAFHLTQAKRRAEIRLRENRQTPADVIAMNLHIAYDTLRSEEVRELGALNVDSEDPVAMVDALDASGVRELLSEVEEHLSLERNARCVEFWENLHVVCAAYVAEMGAHGSSEHRTRLVLDEVKAMLAGKTLDELLVLEEDIEGKLASRDAAVDADYWQNVKAQLVVEKAKATLLLMHEDILEQRLKVARRAREDKSTESDGNAGHDQPSAEEVIARKRQRLEELKRQVLSEQPGPVRNEEGGAERAGSQDISKELYDAELRKEHDPSEAIFSVEAAVPTQTYSWQDKHRPRKPKYFNRVHTGYEWNKYNRTHYDTDNPPPKVVQGYKFNIFYPDLIDKSAAPTYRVERDPEGDEDTVVIRFIAGPPYEDIAFRIVNREWEYNRRRGFRNTFDRGVLQLYFRFKKHFYRR